MFCYISWENHAFFLVCLPEGFAPWRGSRFSEVESVFPVYAEFFQRYFLLMSGRQPELAGNLSLGCWRCGHPSKSYELATCKSVV